MWEDDCSWNKVTSSMETLLEGLGGSVHHSSSSLLSPSSSSSSDFSSSEPISPMSCLSTGSPYSLSSASSSGSISPDTCSPGILCDYDNTSDIFQKGFYFGGGQSGGSIWGSSSGGVLPALHEWRKFDLQQKANSSTLRFIFPEPIIPNLKEEQISSSDSGDEGVTGLGTTTSLSSLVNHRGGDLTCPVSSTTSVATSPPKSNQRSGRESSLTSSRSGSNKLSLFAVGQRAEKFMKSFTTTSSSSSSSPLLATHPLLSGRPFQCQWIDCKASFSQKTCLIEHIDRTHIQTRKDDFSCFWHGCVRRNRPFNARYKLLIHMRVHTGHKPNKCMIPGCDKAFSRLENLKIHHRSHTGERPYICPHCPKAFSNSSDRAKHQRTHFDSKPYACIYPNCTKRYTDPSSLRKHAKMHYLPMKSTVKKESSQRGNNATTFSARNRRKYNNASCGGGGGGNRVSGSLSPVLLSSPALETKSNSESAIIISQTSSLEREKCQLLNGNVDPPLNQLVSYSSSHEPFPLITPQVAKVESEAGVGTTDLDGISLGELDWMQGINFDENFDIDYLL